MVNFFSPNIKKCARSAAAQAGLWSVGSDRARAPAPAAERSFAFPAVQMGRSLGRPVVTQASFLSRERLSRQIQSVSAFSPLTSEDAAGRAGLVEAVGPLLRGGGLPRGVPSGGAGGCLSPACGGPRGLPRWLAGLVFVDPVG